VKGSQGSGSERPGARVRGVLFDLSGVLYVGERAVDGAVEALERVARTGLPARFVTNVSRRPADDLLAHLAGLGIEIAPVDLFTAPVAARRYCESHGLHPYLLVHEALRPELRELAGDPPDAVLVGDAGDGFTYASLNRAFRVLAEGAPLLALGDNRCFREDDGLSLDIGPFVAALEYAADCRATVLGKPAPEFYAAAVQSLGCAPEQAVMIGDDALADVDGALGAGLGACLVRTGKYQPGDEDRITRAGARVVDDVGAAVDAILARA